ncbi:MAG: signal recognition particle-docking protein FtsY [Desulfobulbaceae bacterium DB1]|nr:MAG: signal recognition particle-docking protein FtsY [Desulfobulbaceae bacterium DB1]
MLGWFKKKLKIGKKDEALPQEKIEGEESTLPVVEEQVELAPATVEVVTPEAAEEPVPVPQEEPVGLFSRLKERLAKTRTSFVSRVDELFLGKKIIDPELLDDLEEILITADLGVGTTHELIESARSKVARNELSDPQVLKKVLKGKIAEFIHSSDQAAEMVMPEKGPFIIMVVGVNGVGKTTTIGKMGRKFVQSGRSVMLVAGDTFRAAAVEQLQIWGKRIGVDVLSQQSGADPSAVVYDAMDHAIKKNVDVVIVDTAGRLHTKVNLMEELKKIKRVMDKKIPGAPHEIMLVIDATTGQNAISQARLFGEAVGVTGLTLTKLDGTAKGGIVVNICREFNIPIRFIGIGEKMDDLRDFDADEFVEALFAENER